MKFPTQWTRRLEDLALRTTVALLLFLLVVALPALEIQSVISAAGYEFTGINRGSLRLAWVFQILVTTAWLFVFWWSRPAQPLNSQQSLSEACLERVGVIGISFMALLSGFASVSAPWQNFFTRQRIVSETDLTRKETGLAATQDMLVAKQSRLRALSKPPTQIHSSPPQCLYAAETYQLNAYTRMDLLIFAPQIASSLIDHRSPIFRKHSVLSGPMPKQTNIEP